MPVHRPSFVDTRKPAEVVKEVGCTKKRVLHPLNKLTLCWDHLQTGGNCFPKQVELYQTHVENPTMFWAQLLEDSATKQLEELSEKLQMVCPSAHKLSVVPPMEKVSDRLFCCRKFSKTHTHQKQKKNGPISGGLKNHRILCFLFAKRCLQQNFLKMICGTDAKLSRI